MNDDLDKAPLNDTELNKFIFEKIGPLMRTIQEMLKNLRTQDKNMPYYNFLDKVYEYSTLAFGMFENECKAIKKREEDELDNIEGDIDSVSSYEEDESGAEDVEYIEQKAMVEMSMITASKGFTSDKVHENKGVQIICPTSN